jgi:predicted transcriptional regulator
MSELGPLEQSVLDQVWRAGHEVTVRDVVAALPRRLAYTTIMTTLDRLHRKGLLARRKDGRAFRYAPCTSREQFTAGVVRRWFDRLVGRGPVRPLLASLVDAIEEHEADLLPELQRLVEEKERAAKGRRR